MKKTLTLGLFVLACLIGVMFFLRAGPGAGDGGRVVRLLTAAPEDIRIASPLWRYRKKKSPDWKVRPLEGGGREYDWAGLLEVDRSAPNLTVQVPGGERLSLLDEEAWSRGDTGFTISMGTEEGIPGAHQFRSNRFISLSARIPAASSNLVFEAQSIITRGAPPELSLAIESTWKRSVEIDSPHWKTYTLSMAEVPSGTRGLNLSVSGVKTPGAVFYNSQVFVRRMRVESPTRIRVRTAGEGPEAPVALFSPHEPAEDLLAREPSEALGMGELKKTPWEVYDEDPRWVRTEEADGIARTGVFLITPSRWTVNVVWDEPTTLSFYPMFAPEGKTRADLTLGVTLQTSTESIELWEANLNSEGITESDGKRTSREAAWKEGVRLDLPPIPGDPPASKASLSFTVRSASSGVPHLPILLGEPTLSPTAVRAPRKNEIKADDLADWSGIMTLLRSGRDKKSDPAMRRIWSRTPWEARVALADWKGTTPVPEETRKTILSALNTLLLDPDLYDPTAFPTIEDDGAADVFTVNERILRDALPGRIRRSGKPPSRRSSRPDVIMISIDTLRADAVSALGYEKPTTPWMEEFFGKGGVRFTNVEAPCTYTLPSHASLFLSQYLSGHGVVRGSDAIPNSAAMLAERFSNKGYETSAFVDGGYLQYNFGFAQGFQTYDETGGQLREILPRCLSFLEKRDRSLPLFLFLHTYDVHNPYIPNKAFVDQFVTEGIGPSQARFKKPNYNTLFAANRGEVQLTKKDGEYYRALYDARLAYVDHSLGKFFERIEALEYIEDPLVVVVSDHGEAFGEHGTWTHRTSLFEEETHVPVLFRFPGGKRAGQVVDERASLIDTAPTLFDVLGWDIPDDWEGLPLLSEENLEERAKRRVYSEVVRNPETEQYSSMYNGWIKYLKRQRLTDDKGNKIEVPPRNDVFDLEKDPAERTSLAADAKLAATAEIALMDKALEAMRAQRPGGEGAAGEAALDQDTIQQLQALGYLQ